MCWIPDLQCAWQVLVQCRGPRCHHLLRTMPPSRSARYAQGHDEGMQRAMRSLLGGLPVDNHQQGVAAKIALLPMRVGGLGLRSASRMAVASYWASWADALPMLHGRMPAVAERVTTILARENLVVGCLREVQSAARALDRHGFVGRPDWSELRLGVRPRHTLSGDRGTDSIVRRGPGSSSLSLRRRIRRSLLWVPYSSRIPDPALFVPHADP